MRPSKTQDAGSVRRPPRPLGIIALAAWLGLATGIVEVLTKLACAALGRNGRLYLMSRHFVWLIPLVDFLIFFVAGLVLAVVARIVPRIGRRLSVCCLVTL